MRVLVAGAHGFLGSHIAAALVAAGYDVIGAGRDLTFARRVLPQLDWIACDFNRDTSPEVWLPRLSGVDAVVNAVGVLQATKRDRLQRIHVDSAVALMQACERAGVRRFVQVSALGIETADTEYARTKRAGDEALATTSLDWVVLRTSLVVGRGSYGGTSLMRGLAGLPGLIPLMGGGEFHNFQPILMRDFTRAVVAMVEPGAPARAIVPIAGPERITLKELILTLRQWLGFGSAKVIAIPGSLVRMAARIGDALGWIGVPTAFRTTSIEQMEAGSCVADGDEAVRLPKDAVALRNGLFAEPATVEDRWHARLFFLKPLLRIVLGLYWLGTGLRGAAFMYLAMRGQWREIEIGGPLDAVGWGITFGEPIINVLAGLSFLLRRYMMAGAVAMMGLLSLGVALSSGWLWPGVAFGDHLIAWLFGLWRPSLVIAAILVVLAIERER